MLLSEAKEEFKIRCYYWWVSEFKKEINASFPNLRLFESGNGWKTYNFMRQLQKNEQLSLARAIIKRWHLPELENYDDAITQKEQELLISFDQFTSRLTPREIEVQSRKDAGEKTVMARKQKFRKAVVSKFEEAFGARCFEMKLGKEWDPLFRMKYCGWIVSTQLIFGRRQGVLQYRHFIESETRIAHPQNPQITGPEMMLSRGVGWLVIQWDDVFDGDIEGVCSALIKEAGFFFEVLPNLLKGLEFDRISKSKE